ncbi:hypothetical protein JD844_019777, partial [Phrynosoma platyrhinos]
MSGLPVVFALNASAALNMTIKGNMDFKQRNNFFINGYIKPSAVLQISAHMVTIGALGKNGLNWSTALRTLTSLDGGIQVKRGKEFQVFLNTPEESMEIVYFSPQCKLELCYIMMLHYYRCCYLLPQKGSWIPNEADLHFYMGTPKSELKRNIVIDFHFNIPQKKFSIQFIQPKKKMQMN